MDRARWNQIESVLQEALDREPRERPAFLDASCAHDDDLRRRVEELLQRESRADRLDVPAAATLTLTGMTVGHYRIERRIGAGGMGEVYAARDELLQRVVAVKALAPELTGDADRVRRFEQEAVSASRLNHPNIITIFDVIARDGAHFIVTELIEGQTLRELLISKLEPRRALDLTMQIAMALKAAHTSWIIHRDIKPENIMVRGDGVVKVLDFGIAKLMEEDDAGAVVGTARYMSPEQTRGEPLDGRTDLYSLGLVLHEMLTGERPRAHDSLDRVPREFRPILRRMLHDDREHRYASAAELLDDLLALERRMDGRTARLVVAAALAAALAIATIAALLSRSETWEERTLRDGHTAAARQAVFSPDGRTLVSCGEDGAILVWDVARHERVRTITGAPARNVAFSPDGKWFATGGVDGTVTIWDAMRGAKLRVLRGHHATIDALGISGDGAWLASSSSRNTVLWDARRWTRARDWPYRASYGNLVFSGDTQRILFSFGLAMFDARSGAVSSDPRHSQNWIAVSPDGTGMASVDAAGEVSFYRLASRGDVRAPRLLERRAAHQDHGRSIAYSPDGTLIASAAEDIILWDATTHAKLARFESPAIVWSVAFSPDGRWLLSTHADGALLLWDVAERARVANFSGHAGAVRAVAFSRDGKQVASAGEDHLVTVWDATTGRKTAVLAGHQTRVTAVAFARDADVLASVDHHGRMIVWNVARRRPQVTLTTPPDVPSYAIDLTPRGDVVATSAAVTSLRDRRHLLELKSSAAWPYGSVYATRSFDDGRSLAVVTDIGWLLIFDLTTRRVVAKSLVPHTPQVAVDVSRDGRFLVTGDDAGAVRLWSAHPLRELRLLGRHAARAKSVAFSPDGTLVASAGDDRMIALWNAPRGGLHRTVGTHAMPVYSVAFSPDGRRLVSGEHDASVRIYTRRRTVFGFAID